ncbi:hypothetical protein AALO_G00161370 [Alosa alosa]|uniref:Uncharacterized protein n=1 Tax=Alosa alosa TaxID=278164 RepID=A0AAV6GAB2_9TELE|nr:hypothetical protein AALO_G00161370 [Alosa alosa]
MQQTQHNGPQTPELADENGFQISQTFCAQVDCLKWPKTGDRKDLNIERLALLRSYVPSNHLLFTRISGLNALESMQCENGQLVCLCIDLQ